MASPLLDRLDLDDVLANFKIYNRYHAVASVFIHLGMMYDYLCFFNYIFVTEEVRYRCVAFNAESKDISSNTNISNKGNNSTMWCRNPVLCSEWVYDNPDSFVAEFQLACQDWKRTLVGSMHNFGYMAGLLIIGPLSDRFGRKNLVILTGVVAGVLGPAKSFITSYWIYVVIEFLEAALGDMFSPLFMLAIEMVATKSRVTYTAICKLGLGIGGILLPLIAWLVPYWRTFLRVSYTPGLLSIFLIYLIDESPRWLLAKGKKEEAIKIIRNAAELNKIEIKANLNKISYEKDEGLSFINVLRDTFKSRPLLKRFFVCFIWWSACTFVNYGLIVNSILLDGNKYVNFGLLSTMKSLSIVIAGYIINKFNRRGPLIFCFVACAALCIGQPFIPKNLLWLKIINYMVGMLMAAMCFNITCIFTSELFPTQSRNSMHSLCSATGRIGAVLSPQTPLLAAYWSGLPTAVFGAVSLSAGLVTLLVPETADQNLPDTVCQAETMKKK